ncbi:MAG: cytochrome c, partial [Nitrososphaerales archaeon]
HDFSTVMNDDSLTKLAQFISEGTIDLKQYINYDTKKPIGGDESSGKQLYDSTCAMCHGADGLQILFGGEDGVGTIANGNPWEFIHKVRFGQPGTPMPAGVENGWTIEDIVDVLTYSQTLPE